MCLQLTFSRDSRAQSALYHFYYDMIKLMATYHIPLQLERLTKAWSEMLGQQTHYTSLSYPAEKDSKPFKKKKKAKICRKLTKSLLRIVSTPKHCHKVP